MQPCCGTHEGNELKVHLLRYLATSSAVALVIAVAGCSGGTPLPKMYPVTGRVETKAGKPMKGGSIQFNLASDPLLRVVGEIQDDGAFTLRTVKDNSTGPGAPEGEYQVVVTPALVMVAQGDLKIAHKGVDAIPLAQTFKIEAKENTLKIVLPE